MIFIFLLSHVFPPPLGLFIHRKVKFLYNTCFHFFPPNQPKWGCLPTSRFISKRNAIKKSVTRFRMLQAWKLQKGEVILLLFLSQWDLTESFLWLPSIIFLYYLKCVSDPNSALHCLIFCLPQLKEPL